MGYLNTAATILTENGLRLISIFGLLYIFIQISVYWRLRHIKGPPLSGFTRWPERWAILRGRPELWYEDACAKYGSLARIGPSFLMTSDPELFIYVTNHPDYKRAEWFYSAVRLEHRRDNVISMSDNALHNQRRKVVAPGYSGKENHDFESSIDGRVGDLIGLIREKYVSADGQAVFMNMAEKINFLAADAISEICLGKRFGMLAGDSDVHDYLDSAMAGSQLLTLTHGLGIEWLAQAPVIGRFIIPSEHDNGGFGKNLRFCYKFVREREAAERKEPSGRKDMLASFMRHGLAGRDLTSEALVAVIGGLQSTSDAIAAILLQLMTSPGVYAKLQAEVGEACSDGRAPPPGTGNIISTDAVRKLSYLQAVIREGLRRHPPNCGTFPRDVPPSGDMVRVDGKDVFVPGGTSIGIAQRGVQYSRTVFGDDAEAFRPERWFEEDQHKLAAMTRANDLIFSYGRFGCLGQVMAKIEIGKAIFEIARHFDLSLVRPLHPCKTENVGGGFVAISDMWVLVHEREI